MSAEVTLDELVKAIEQYDIAYLVSVGEDSQPHVVAVDPVPREGRLRIVEPGPHTRRNIATHPSITLLWAPRQPTGYSLIVDGLGALHDDRLDITPTRAILHRAATPSHAHTDGGCCGDCRHISLADPHSASLEL
ncbi:pyridoxamine 5'-phosphate oxidase family protein [Nocardia sp. NBC_00403]|uniref:pyridoxamine 5'-phosphate oxidase family protein n=1 Tax=Nocardia sp. NBC_00403 TaxID=2975990 RepID=UPI002E20A481